MKYKTTLLFILFLAINLSAQVSPPKRILGFEVGADYNLADYDQAVEYFNLLAKESPKFKVMEMGKTSMGRPMIYGIITSEKNMKNLEHYKTISRKLALGEGLTDEKAEKLASEGKAVVWIDVGIHATECAPTQHALQLAYELVTKDDSDTRLILDNTIALLIFANPDGMQIVADWYHPNVETPYETSSLPWLYNKYVGHDNNRDSYMNNLMETRNITHLLNRTWYPVILYDHHQTAPFPARIWIPPAAEPTNPNLHPLFIRGKNLIGSAMGYAFDREGKDGAISRFAFDFIYPGYEDSFGDFFHIISIMTETALYRYATPRFYTLNDFPEAYRDFTPSVFYPSPWKGGWWRLKDAVDYCLTASKAVLHTAAVYRERFLYGKYQMGKDVTTRFSNEPPYAWIIPQEQWDPPTAALLVNRMLLQGIKIFRADDPFKADGVSYPAGTWVIPMNQPFALFIKAVFEEQEYPDLTKYPTQWQGVVSPQNFPDAYLPPYDMAGWSLPHQMGVKTIKANNPLKATLTRIEKAELQLDTGLPKAGYAYLISPQINNGFTAINRILKKGGKVQLAQAAFKVKGKSYPAGTKIILSRSVSSSFMQKLSKDLSIEIKGTGSRIPVKIHTLKAPRTALYRSWRASMDEGWTRWLFEQFEFPFANIYNAEIKAGSLRTKYDVLVIPSMSTNAIIDGHTKGTIPPKYVGGIEEAGVRNIKIFVEEGGTLITMNSGCNFALDKLGLPVGDALKDVRPQRRRYGQSQGKSSPVKFACPGSILRMKFDSTHPVAYGMPENGFALFYRSLAFKVYPSSEKTAKIISNYPDESLLTSGFLVGEKYLKNKAAAVEVQMGKGKVILLGFGVKSRAQPYGTFKLLFNSLYYGALK